MTVVWVFGGAAVLLLGPVIWAGHRMLTAPGAGSGGASDALGNFIDVFDPARARADRDLESHKNMGEVLPSPDDDDHPRWTVDLHRSQAYLSRPRP